MPKRRQPQNKIEKRGLWSSVWPICYSSVILLTHSYLLYQGISRYLLYRSILPSTATHQLTLICISALLLPLIVIISFIKSGSYTNDAVQVGYGLLKKEIADKVRPSCSRLHLGAPPLAAILYVICAYLLLIGNVFTVAEGKKYKIYSDSSLKKPFLLESESLTLNTSSLLTDQRTIPSTSLELANLIVSLTICSYRTVSVFWQTSRLFTLLYWFQVTAATILHVLSYLGFKTLYTEMVITKVPTVFLLDKSTLVILYILSNIVLFMSSWCVFHFGYGSILEKMRHFLKNLGHHQDMESECGVYLPHVLALSSILLYVGCNAPVMYDYVSMYSDTKNQLLIAHLISCVVYMLLWILLWFSFTVKQNWKFEINEISLKRYAILLNRAKFFVDNVTDGGNDGDVSCQSNEIQTVQQLQEVDTNSEDNLSNSTTSTNNGAGNRSTNGILSHKINSKYRKKSSEQKVKFQEATKIVIETNLDSDLETIPESDTECADSAMFSGSGGSNDSNESQPTIHEEYKFKKPSKPNYKDLILNPNNIQLLANKDQQRRMWSSTGDLETTSHRRLPLETVDTERPKSVITDPSSTNYITAPYTPRNHTANNFVSNGHEQLFHDRGMSSAV